MKKKYYKWIVLGFLLSLVCPSIALGAYYIKSSNLGNNTQIVDPNNKNTLNKIIFKDFNGNIISTKYLKGNSRLDVSNVPVIGDSRVQWKENNSSGQVILDLCDKNKLEYIPTKDMVLQATQVAPSTNISSGVTNKLPNSKTTIISNNKVTLNQDKTVTQGNNLCNNIEIGGSFNNVNIDATFRGRNGYNGKEKDVITNDLGFHNLIFEYHNQANSDETIGLEDPTSSNSMYKPKAGNASSAVNCCVSKIILNSDLIIKNGALNIGAMVGFFGNLDEWSQRNIQGFIIGNYSELDLNGHNLIIGSGGHLNAYGSITNSVLGKGKVIVNNGGTMLATCVVEEHNCERALPIQYYHGGEVFSYIKMPYLSCDVQINQGGQLNATLKLDFGGNNANYVDTILPLIGNGNNYLIQMASGSGYVLRKCIYDEQQFNLNCDFANKNLMQQKITYEFHDIPDLRLNSINISVKISVEFTLDLAKNGLIIPPYFQIYLYNTKINIPMYLTFVPGSYFFADEKSIINLTSSAIKTFTTPAPRQTDMANYDYQTVGSLNFASEKYRFNDAVKNPQGNNPNDPNFNWTYGWVDDSETPHFGSGGGHMLIRRNTDPVHSYWNKNRRAHADILGKIQFADIVSYNANSLKHELGGEINIKDVEMLKNSIGSKDNVTLFASSAHFGPCYAYTKPLKDHVTNVTDYYIAPLVSNGNVLMDPNNQGKVRSDYTSNPATYDKKTGIITYFNGDKYGFIHTNGDYKQWNGAIDHVKKVCYTNGDYASWKGSYFGKFIKITTVNPDKSITVPVNANGITKYIWFRGAFMPWDGNKVNIQKLKGANSNLMGNFIRNNNKWEGKQAVALGNLRPAKRISNDGYYGYELWKLGI